MALFGWFTLLFLAVITTGYTVLSFIVSKGLCGRIESFVWFTFCVAIGFWYLVYNNFPFIVKVIE